MRLLGGVVGLEGVYMYRDTLHRLHRERREGESRGGEGRVLWKGRVVNSKAFVRGQGVV